MGSLAINYIVQTAAEFKLCTKGNNSSSELSLCTKNLRFLRLFDKCKKKTCPHSNSHVNGEIGERRAHAEDEATAEHGRPLAHRLDDVAGDGHDGALGHPPHGLHHDEVVVRQAGVAVLPGME